jgi:hypothetical protein
MDSWTHTVSKWIDAGCLYRNAVIRADEYEKEHRAVDEKHAKLLADFKAFKVPQSETETANPGGNAK